MLAEQDCRSAVAAPGAATDAGRSRADHLCAALRPLVGASRMYGVFASLVGSQVGSALLGLVFWTVAARKFTPEQVGNGAALVAAMTMLSVFGVLGIGTLFLERFKVIPVAHRRALFSTGLSVAGMGGALVGAGWLGLSALLQPAGVLGRLPLSTALLLVASTAIAAICIAYDQAAIGMHASSVQLRRNLIASALRIAVLFTAIELDISNGQVILVSWTVGLVGSLLAAPLRRRALAPRSGDCKATTGPGEKSLDVGRRSPLSHLGVDIEQSHAARCCRFNDVCDGDSVFFAGRSAGRHGSDDPVLFDHSAFRHRDGRRRVSPEGAEDVDRGHGSRPVAHPWSRVGRPLGVIDLRPQLFRGIACHCCY